MKRKKWLIGIALLTFMAYQSGGQTFAEESETPVEGIIEEIGVDDIQVVSEQALDMSAISDFSVEQVRKIQDYQKKYREIRNNEVVDEKFDIAPIIGPDQYTIGSFKPSTLQNATDYINLLRESAGMPPVSISQSRVSIAQHGAVGLASLRVIDHYIETNYTKPEGMTEQFWQEASKGARSSNLVRSVRSPIHGDLIPTLNDFSDMYMFDYGSNNQTVGHRRVILNPLYKTIGFGFAQLEVPEKREVEYTGALYAQRDSGNTVSDDSITTWPTETIFPVQNMRRYNNTLRWSVSFNSIGYDFDQKNLKVTLTNNKNGQEWNFSNEQKDGEFTISTNNWGYDTVVFAPNGINYAEGDEYTVKVDGLIGKLSSYEYTTKLYDLNKEYKIPMEDFNFDDNFIKMQLGEERKVNVSYSPDDVEHTGNLVWKSSNANLVSVSQDGILKAKSANGQSLTITATSEDGKIKKNIKVSIATIQPGATKENAQEIDPGFVTANGQSSQIYVNQTGWVKFKVNESAMYGLVGGIFGTNVVNQKSEINFYNGWENRSLGYSSLQRKTSNSATGSSNLPVYYAAGDYVYLKLSTSIDGEPFYFSLTRNTNNAQPIYTKKVTIKDKYKALLNPGSSTSYSYKIDDFTTKPNDIRYSSDDEEIAEVVGNGNNSIKIIGKKPGKTTIHIREVSGSNQEDSVEVEVFSLGQTQESATEIQPVFGNKAIFANQTGWLKFRAPETAKYTVQTLISQDTITSKHRIETNFYNETQWRGYYYMDFAIGGRSATSGDNLPLSYEKDDYVYVHIANRKVNAPYYLTFSYSK